MQLTPRIQVDKTELFSCWMKTFDQPCVRTPDMLTLLQCSVKFLLPFPSQATTLDNKLFASRLRPRNNLPAKYQLKIHDYLMFATFSAQNAELSTSILCFFSLNSLLNGGETGHKMFSFHWRWEVQLLVARSPLMSKLRFHHASLQATYWPPTWGAPSSQKSQVGEERHKFACLSPNAVSAVIVIVRVRGDMVEWIPVEEKVKEFSSKITALEDIPCQRD